METSELLEIISRGEDSFHQFKVNITNQDSLAEDMVAFSNSGGGHLIIGVDDKSLEIIGLSPADIRRLNGLISNAASQSVKPAINPITENISTAQGLVMVVTIQDGVGKPYMDKNGVILLKSAGDKRRATSREEIQRMFQRAGLIHGDEIPANGMTLADIDMDYFRQFYQTAFGET
jgi:ATP-dependent DNA helicase RecG